MKVTHHSTAMICDIPTELLTAFVANPLCQLRYTCRRFYAEIQRDVFKYDGDKVFSDWYSVSLPLMKDLTYNGELVDMNNVFGLCANYLVLEKDLMKLRGIITNDPQLIPYMVTAGFGVYKWYFHRTIPAKCGLEYICQVRGITPGVGISVQSKTQYPIPLRFIWVNYIDEFSLPALRRTDSPALIYRKINCRYFYAKYNNYEFSTQKLPPT